MHPTPLFRSRMIRSMSCPNTPSEHCERNHAGAAWLLLREILALDRITGNMLTRQYTHKVSNVDTGNTRGMPPRTGLDPSRIALSLRNNCSLPLPVFQESALAPKSKISTRSPLGSVATMRVLSWVIDTTGAATSGEIGISAGLFVRSTMIV